MRLVVTGIVFLAALGALIWFAIDTIPVLKIREVQAGGHTGECRIDEGVVHSIERPGDPLEFTVRAGDAGGALLQVRSPLLGPPDNFKVGINVSLRGTFDPAAKKFAAQEILTKCPSRYEASKMGDEAVAAGEPAAAKVP